MGPLARKLRALQYPNLETFDVNDPLQVKTLIIWLEDRKIRNLVPEERVNLRLAEGEAWSQEFERYQTTLEISRTVSMSASIEDRLVILDEILSLAVSLEYEDGAEKFKKILKGTKAAATVSSGEEEVAQSQSSMVTDAESEVFARVVRELSELLGIPSHEDNAIRLQAVCNLLEQLAAKSQQTQAETAPTQVDPSIYPLGLDTGDPVLNKAATILRLLYVHDLRHVQSSVNEIVVTLQQFTANPKTDARLGKVGV